MTTILPQIMKCTIYLTHNGKYITPHMIKAYSKSQLFFSPNEEVLKSEIENLQFSESGKLERVQYIPASYLDVDR